MKIFSQSQSGGSSSLPDPVTESHGGTNQTTYAKGDIIHATAANTLGKLAIGTQGQFPAAQSTGLLAYQDFFDISKSLYLVDDFLSGYVATNQFSHDNNLNGSVSGAGAAVGWDTGQTSANPGVVGLDAGTTTTGAAVLVGTGSGVQNLFLGGGTTLFETIIKLSALSDGTNTYSVVIGLTSGDLTLPQVNGIYFTYSSTINSGNWTGNTSAASTATTVNSAVAATANFTRLGFSLNSAGTTVTFYVNGTSVGTSSTNIPTAGVRFYWAIIKSAGTTSRRLSIDAYKLLMQFATPR